jgi:integrase
MAKIMTMWRCERGQITESGLSDGRGEIFRPSVVERRYKWLRTESYLGNVGLNILDQAFALASIAGPKHKPDVNDNWHGFAFPSRIIGRPIGRHAFSRAMKRLTTVLGIVDATPHDFRRTGTTNITGEHIGIPRFIVSRVLNQLSDTGGAAAVTGIYDRNEYLTEKRRALEAWSALLVEITGDQKRGSNVVQLAASNDAN